MFARHLLNSFCHVKILWVYIVKGIEIVSVDQENVANVGRMSLQVFIQGCGNANEIDRWPFRTGGKCEEWQFSRI
ncbi:hypothetical protein Plhal304r1_c021g0073361 [Plasmopara halstedii]